MLVEKIKQDQLQARKAKDPSAALLTTVLGEVAIVGKNAGNRETTDAEAVVVIEKFVKNIKETLSLTKDTAVVTKLNQELDILSVYLPKQMTADEMKTAVTQATQLGNTTVGDVMKYFKQTYPGQYDGKALSALVKEML
jgi:uncharacterized protein YqeY